MRPNFIAILLISSTFICKSQVLPLSWAKSWGGTYDDHCNSIQVDKAGNVYTTGAFQNTVDFNPNVGIDSLSSEGSLDIFISKLDNSGNLIWARRIGGSGNDEGTSIQVDDSNNVYVCGYFENTVDFDPGMNMCLLTSWGNEDFFILKLDSQGNMIWVKSIGGASVDIAFGIALDNSNNVYTVGQFGLTVDFDPDTAMSYFTAVASFDIFISKLSSSGNYIWTKQIGGPDIQIGKSIVVDNSGSIYTAGYFTGSADFDPGIGIEEFTATGWYDSYISKLDSTGNFVWAKQIAGSLLARTNANSMAIDAVGSVYTTGYFTGSADFDPDTSASAIAILSAGSADAIFISKLNSDGNYVWAKHIGSSSASEVKRGFALALDDSANVYTTGFFKGTADFDPGIGVANLTPSCCANIFILKLDSSGIYKWAFQQEGSPSAQRNVGQTIAIDEIGNIYTAGNFVGTVDFDPDTILYNLSSKGSFDCFVYKLGMNAATNINNHSQGNVVIYPNPGNGVFSINSPESSMINIYNVLGEKVYSNHLEKKNWEIDLSSEANGLYFIEFHAKNVWGLYRIMIQK